MDNNLTQMAQEASASLAAWKERQSVRQEKAIARQAKKEAAAEGNANPAGEGSGKVDARETTKLLVAMAAWGSREGVELILRSGGDLSEQDEEQMTPALAAIWAGHAALAVWMMERPQYQWVADRHKGGNTPTELRVAIMASARHPHMLDFAKSVAKKRPSLWDEPTFSKEKFWGRDKEDESLIFRALTENPKAASWMIGERPLAAKSILEAATQNNEPYRSYVGEFSMAALILAIGDGDEACASFLLEYARPLIETPWGKGPGSEACGANLISRIFKEDNAAALGWIFAKCPKLAAEALAKVRSQGRPWRLELNTRSGMKFEELTKEFNAGARTMAEKARRGSLATWAAHEKADSCLEMILGMPSFKSQVASMQSDPEFGWVDVFMIVDPKRVELLAEAGFDFAKQAPGDWGYAAIGLCGGDPTIKWLEMIGKRFSDLLGPRSSDGKTAFEVAEMFLSGQRSQRAGEASSNKVGKWAAICEKAAMKAGAGRGKSSKAIKAKSARRL